MFIGVPDLYSTNREGKIKSLGMELTGRSQGGAFGGLLGEHSPTK